MACPRSDGSAGGRRKHRPPRSPDRLQASDRWLPTQATTGRDLPVLPPHETPRTSPLGRPQGPGYPRMRGGSRTVPMETPSSLGPPPQADPLRIGPQNRLLRRLRTPPLGFQDPIGPTGLAGIWRVPVPIPSLLDDVPTPASTAPVSPGLRNPGTPPREDSLYDTSLTKRSPPWRLRKRWREQGYLTEP